VKTTVKAKILEAKYEAKLEFLGGRWDAKQKPSVEGEGGGDMDISGTAQYTQSGEVTLVLHWPL